MNGRNGNWVEQAFHRCPPCGKLLYASRAEAKRARRRMHRGDGLHIYPCPESDTGFHLGHLQPVVLHGRLTRDDVYRRGT